MQHNLAVSETAFTEIGSAFDYYENQSPGLGYRFLNSVESAFEILSKTPQYFSFINSQKDIRDMKIKHFPYVIIFQIIENKVQVISVFNTNRNPLSFKNLYKS